MGIGELKYQLETGKGFYAMLFGRGKGCDYTIGCNFRVDPIYAETIEEAEEIVRHRFLGKDGEDGEDGSYSFDIEDVAIVEASKVWICDLNDYRKKYDENIRKQKEDEQTKKDREIYEKLKARFDMKMCNNGMKHDPHDNCPGRTYDMT